MHGLLDRLARLDEPGERAVHARRPTRVPREQDVLTAMHEHDDARRQAWIVDQAATLALVCAIDCVVAHRPAATSAESMVAMPLEQLLRAPGEIEERRLDAAEPASQADRRVALRRPTRRVHRVARAAAKTAEIDLGLRLDVEPAHRVVL